MNITELDSYNLADAVKFNDQLNPAIWSGEKMKPEVREKLMVIAQDFKEFLGLSDLEVKDITVSGSNAGYTYTPHSDIDLHLVVDIPQADESDVYRELFDAKKYQYNDQHNITIGGYDVELYVEDARKQPVSQGIYSVLNNDWVKIPLKRKATVNDEAVKSKFEDIGQRIESAIASGNSEKIATLARKIKNMRQAGLDEHGELGAENLAYKMLRNQGMIKKLYDARQAAQDAEMSLNERRKKKKAKKKTKYGYGGYFYPGYSFNTGTDASAVDMGGDGGGGESMYESAPTTEQTVQDFVNFCVDKLNIENNPNIRFKRDPAWSKRNRTFGSYNHDTNELIVSLANRHVMDILRTVAHELTHQRQGEIADMPADAGETGSRWENEANAKAGVLMREYGQQNPTLFAEQPVEEGWKEKAAGLAAAACIAGTPGCATTTAGTVKDVQTVGRTAQAAKGLTKAGVQAELDQELRNFIRAQGQGPGSANAKNQSRLYQLQKKMEKPEPQNESASGYIPTKKQAKDPRFSMALTQDIKPGQVGREANKLGLETDSQGQPDVLIKGLRNALREFKETGRLDRFGNQPPIGPETKPTMPAGTLRVDVSDVYDWYKLGQHISDLEGLGQHDFGQGPPSAIISFGDEDTEHKFIKNIKATGLDVTDIDPKDPVKRAGRKIKTDPTYNVDESEQLDEVKMSPGALRKFANSPEAEGILAGFEAELIFRDTQADEDSGDMEADMDYDERARSIDEVIEFFMHDDYGYGMSDRQADRLRDQLDEAYFEWRDDQIIDAFNRESEDLVREIWLEERPMNERILSALVDGIGMDDAEADKILAIGDKAPRFTKTSDQTAYKEANPGYDKYLEAVDIADAILDEEVEASIDNQDGYYDQALDNFRDSYEGDDSDFFNDMGWRWMSDIMNEFNLDWPYYTGGGSNGGTREWSDIAKEIQQVTGMPVDVGYGYHSKKRVPDEYVLEPDGSLSPDDSYDFGLELVSPPMPLNKAIEQLEAIIDWANTEGNAYTNSSTGLHMGISIPFKGGDVDYLKLILFMGDQYVLEKFGRAANTYTASALEKLKQNVAGSKNRGDDKITTAMELMKNNLIELAQRYVQQGVGNSKYTSAHIKPGYIEFRSPGGDYLSVGDQGEQDALASTMRRFAYAMYLAGRPDLERPEYYKKLYKLIAPEGNKDLEMFAKFSAGEITAEQLKKQWAEKTIGKELTTNQRWQLYQFDPVAGEFTPVPGQSYNGFTEDEVKNRVWAKYGREALDSGEYKLVNASEDQQWEVFDVKTGKTLEIVKGKNKGAVADAVYDKYVGQGIGFNVRPYVDPATLTPRAKLAKRIAQPKDYVIINNHSKLPFYTFSASSQTQAVDIAVRYLQDKGLDTGNFSVQRATNVKQDIDNRVDSRQLQQRVQATDQYEIVDRRNSRVVLQYRADDAADAGDKFNHWLRNQGMPQDTENYGWRPKQAVNDIPITIDQQAPRADYELYQHETPDQVFRTLRNVTADEVRSFIDQQERGGMPPGFLRVRQVSESIDDAQKARNAMDAAAKKMGYDNFAAVPPNARNVVMQMAVNALKLDSGHYNMLDRKNKVKETKVTPVAPVRQDATRTKYNQVPRKDDPAPNPAVILKISPEAKKQKK
ncbi:Putative amidoligase enzyme [uncultured Caudovirales phage]|uniref:Amidoligase enzyme n=1 Tax=uncultured Caudovirales phage TaxID=2100421 RepID=A0A6J5M1C6_9CAUD|nr:Putative amidoligase enzyme [uncultured Caudovirales phage]